MDLPQIYTTTLLHPHNRELRWQFLTLPRRSVLDDITVSFIRENFGPMIISHVQPSRLPFLVAAMLDSDLAREEQYLMSVLSRQTSEILQFAEQIVFRQLIPFEHLSLAQESLANIIATATDAAAATDTILTEPDNGRYFLTVVSSDGVVIGSLFQNFVDGIWERFRRWIIGG